MSKRQPRDEDSSIGARETEANKGESFAESLVKSRVNRVAGAGISGLQASSMGLMLGGCIALGYFAGNWLDGRFGTTYLMPIGVLVGLAAGFREMFRTLKQLNANTHWPSAETRAAASRANRGKQESLLEERVLDTRATQSDETNVTEPETIRPRIFHVPAPPLASFEGGDVRKQEVETSVADDMNIEQLTQKLLGSELLESDTASSGEVDSDEESETSREES